MTFLKNISIKWKLLLIVIFPLAGVSYFSIIEMIDRSKAVVNVAYANKVNNTMLLIEKVAIKLQENRGVSLRNSINKDEIENIAIAQNVDSIQKELYRIENEYSSELDINSKSFLNHIGVAQERLSLVRKGVISKDPMEIFLYYTEIIETLLDSMAFLIKNFHDSELIFLEESSNRIFQIIEACAQERGIIFYFLSDSDLTSSQIPSKWLFYLNRAVSNQNILQEVFYDVALEKQINLYQQLMNEKTIVDKTAMISILFHDGKIDELNLSAQEWWSAQTNYIDKLITINIDIEHDMLIALASSRSHALSQLIFAIIILVVCFIASVFFIAYFFFYFNKSIFKALQFAKNIQNNRLETPSDVQLSEDEFGSLFKANKAMIESLSNFFEEIKKSSEILKSSSENFDAMHNEFLSNMSETSTAVAETSTMMEEVRKTSDVAESEASKVASSSEELLHVMDKGLESVNVTLEQISLIKKQIDIISKAMYMLNEKNQNISKIISTVTNLSDKTDLLSVNAAIEAAKAGEFGKGFNVVAAEVKNLAEQSKLATDEIKNILSEIQKSTVSSLNALEKGIISVDTGLEKSEESGSVIKHLQKVLNDTIDAMKEILSSTRSQKSGVIETSTAMKEINQSIVHQNELLKKMNQASEDLLRLRGDLIDKINIYRL